MKREKEEDGRENKNKKGGENEEEKITQRRKENEKGKEKEKERGTQSRNETEERRKEVCNEGIKWGSGRRGEIRRDKVLDII